jgi:hypothetical protein
VLAVLATAQLVIACRATCPAGARPATVAQVVAMLDRGRRWAVGGGAREGLRATLARVPADAAIDRLHIGTWAAAQRAAHAAGTLPIRNAALRA